MEKRFFIYRIRHEASGKSYIGWTINVQKRWRRHINDAAKGKKTAIHRALAKYGVDAFSFSVLEEGQGTSVEAHAKEIWWISTEGCQAPSGYNMTEGGDGAHGLGQLAAASHARKRALDPAADSAARSERTRQVMATIPIEVRSRTLKLVWAQRPELRSAQSLRMKARAALESAEARSQRARHAHKNLSPEHRTERAKRANAALTVEQRGRAVAAMQAVLTPEIMSERGKLGAKAKQAKTTPEERRASALKRWESVTPQQHEVRSRKISNTQQAFSPERKAEIAKRRWETRRRRAAELLKSTE